MWYDIARISSRAPGQQLNQIDIAGRTVKLCVIPQSSKNSVAAATTLFVEYTLNVPCSIGHGEKLMSPPGQQSN